MLSLSDDLRTRKNNIEEFIEVACRVLNYLPAVFSSVEEKGVYQIYYSANNYKYFRPVNKNLFISTDKEFQDNSIVFKDILESIRRGNRTFDAHELNLIDSVTYTVQQSIGLGLDALVAANSARKHVGNRFEELIKCLFTDIGISNKKIVLQIPYLSDQGKKVYKCENDLILSPYDKPKSSSTSIHPDEIVVSIKTTSKDRMGKMFIDKMLLERFVGHDLKVIGIFLNDVQRKEADNISHTLVSNLFMVYTQFLTQLEGVYYLDSPPNAFKKPFTNHMSKFSRLITKDIWNFLSP